MALLDSTLIKGDLEVTDKIDANALNCFSYIQLTNQSYAYSEAATKNINYDFVDKNGLIYGSFFMGMNNNANFTSLYVKAKNGDGAHVSLLGAGTSSTATGASVFSFTPWVDETTTDLGRSGAKWRNLWLSGKINDLTLPTGTKTLATTSDFVNPNLIINSDFSINQRGASSYTGTYAGTLTADCWRLHDQLLQTNHSTLTFITNGGAIINNPATTFTSALYQPIEDWSKIVGQTITITCNCVAVSGTVRFGPMYRSSGSPQFITSQTCINGEKSFSWTATAAESGQKRGFGFFIEASSSVSIKWIKAEIGSRTTYIAPFAAEEKWRCQRYFQLFGPSSTLPAADVDYRPIMAGTITTGTVTIGDVTYKCAKSSFNS